MSMDSIVNTNVLTIYTPKLGNNGAAQSGILGGSPNVQTKANTKDVQFDITLIYKKIKNVLFCRNTHTK